MTHHEKNDEDFARVGSPKVTSDVPDTAAENKAKGATVTPISPEREAFLRHVGDPDEAECEAARMHSAALHLWRSIRDEFYRADGKPRRTPPSSDAVLARRQVDNLYAEASDLRRLAGRQRREHEDPWSHTRSDVRVAWSFTQQESTSV